MAFSRELALFVFIGILLLSLFFSYPHIFLTDEWITVDQLNHLVTGENPLYGYSPYGAADYAASHHNVLCYTLALPVVSLPAYYLFSLFGDDFRLVVILLWSTLLLALLLMIELWYPRFARWRGIPWTYAAIASWGILFVLNMALSRPFWFVRGVHPADVSVYPEVAAVVFTNGIAFALFGVVAFLIFREIFGSDRWGVFGLVAVICSSSYLFWSGNAKDHMLVALFFSLAAYFALLALVRDEPLHYVSAFIAAGWTAWARPEVGLALTLGLLAVAILASVGKGWKRCVLSAAASIAVLVGALPLFVNNYALSGAPLVLPWSAAWTGNSTIGTLMLQQYTLNLGQDVLLNLYGILVDPWYDGAAGFFQVSPISFFALIGIGFAAYLLYTGSPLPLTARDRKAVLLFGILGLVVFIAYFRSFGMASSPGIIPDMRYLSPAYLPLVGLGLITIRGAGFGEKEIGLTLKTLGWLCIVALPISYVALQATLGSYKFGQVTTLTVITYLFLAAASVLLISSALRKKSIAWFAYALAPVMVISLLWEFVVGFRFATLCWEGYHFWIPVVQYAWYIQYWIFPF